jgi:hypothetical protein
MSLDVNSPKGLITVIQEDNMLKYVEESWGVTVIKTNKNDSAVCDGILVKDNVLVGIFESKCRNLSLSQLEEYGSWLITHEKIKACRLLSEYLKVPFIGFLYLIKDNLTMYWNITNKNGKYEFEFETANTETRRTINSGTTIRENAFLPINKGKFVQSRKIIT